MGEENFPKDPKKQAEICDLNYDYINMRRGETVEECQMRKQVNANFGFIFLLYFGTLILYFHILHVLTVHVKNCRDSTFRHQVDDADEEPKEDEE